MRKATWIREYLALAVILVALGLLFGALSGRFLTTATFGAIANRIPTLALAATGMTLVLIVGGIDLSIGSVLALAGAVLGVALVDWHWPFAACAALAVAVGLVAGLANGALIVGLTVPPFIVTLGMMEMARGAAYLVTHSQTKYLGAAVEGLARPLGGTGLSGSFLLALLVVGLAQLLLSSSVLGRWMFATGSNEIATRYSGIDPRPVKLSAYALTGAAAGLGAVCYTSRLGASDPERRRGPGTFGHRGGGHRRDEFARRARLGHQHLFWRAHHRHVGSGPRPGRRFRTGEAAGHGRGDRPRRAGGRLAAARRGQPLSPVAAAAGPNQRGAGKSVIGRGHGFPAFADLGHASAQVSVLAFALHHYLNLPVRSPAAIFTKKSKRRSRSKIMIKTEAKRFRLTFIVALGIALSALAADRPPAPSPVKIIFDTDIGNDVDDALALGLLHSLADRGACELLGVTITRSDELAGPFVDAVNTFYGRPNLPIGFIRAKPETDTSKFLPLVEARDGERVRYPHDLKRSSDAPDALRLLRQLLAAQPDGSVVLVQVGYFSNFAALLDTPADDFPR